MEKIYILTEKGADSFRRFGTPAQAGDPYTRKVREDVLRQYIRDGFITEAEEGGKE